MAGPATSPRGGHTVLTGLWCSLSPAVSTPTPVLYVLRSGTSSPAALSSARYPSPSCRTRGHRTTRALPVVWGRTALSGTCTALSGGWGGDTGSLVTRRSGTSRARDGRSPFRTVCSHGLARARKWCRQPRGHHPWQRAFAIGAAVNDVIHLKQRLNRHYENVYLILYIPKRKLHLATIFQIVEFWEMFHWILVICPIWEYHIAVSCNVQFHDDVIKWKHFPRCWPFVRVIHRWPVNSPHKGQWRGALMFPLISVWTNGWINTRGACNLRRRRSHYDVTVYMVESPISDVSHKPFQLRLSRAIFTPSNQKGPVGGHVSYLHWQSYCNVTLNSFQEHHSDVIMVPMASQITILTIVYSLSRLFRRRSKKTSKLRVTGLCAGNSPVTGEFPAQMASNAENFSIDDVIINHCSWYNHKMCSLSDWN